MRKRVKGAARAKQAKGRRIVSGTRARTRPTAGEKQPKATGGGGGGLRPLLSHIAPFYLEY